MRSLWSIAALMLACLGVSGPARAQQTPAGAAAPAHVGHELTQADADAWLDGFVPNALEQSDIAGAVVVIVRDGRVLTERGFGYADIAARTPVDPETTLFRAGSTSKLFTWISVMQLVEQGRLNLDADVNTYLDFRIPPFHGQPLTLRQIMTHTPGFEEAFKGGITYSENAPPPLGQVVRALLPERVFAPGTTPAYSNYATALAGYIVERVSGTPFNAYVEQHIFGPLGMDHSTFRQPVPAPLHAAVARGYATAHQAARGFELVSVPPAGSLSITGADAARFMIANLNQGGGVVRPQTLALMWTPATDFAPGLNRMGLGFYQQNENDFVSVGHGGDLNNFHTYLYLVPARNVGFFISMNSTGVHGAAEVVRRAIFEQFADRYYPASDQTAPVELATAREHARLLVGNYFSSRGVFSNFIDFGNFLGQTSVGLDESGRPLVPDLFGGPSRSWIETAPFQWREANGHGRLAAVVAGGHVVRWSVNDVSPFMVWLPVPWYRDASWLMPLWLAALGVIALTAFAWPVRAVVRRAYGAKQGLSSTRRHAARVTNLFCWLALTAMGGWMVLLDALSDGPSDTLIWLAEIGGAIGFLGLAAASVWNVIATWNDARSWGERFWSMLVAAGAAIVLYVAIVFHLIHFGVNY